MPTNRTSTSAYMAAKPEDVFAAVSDLTRHPQFAANRDLTVEAVSEGDATVGSEYRSKVRFMGSNVEAELRVAEFSTALPVRLRRNGLQRSQHARDRHPP